MTADLFDAVFVFTASATPFEYLILVLFDF